MMMQGWCKVPSLKLKIMHRIIAEELVFKMFNLLPTEMDCKLSEEIAKKAALVTIEYLSYSAEPNDLEMIKDLEYIEQIIKEI